MRCLWLSTYVYQDNNVHLTHKGFEQFYAEKKKGMAEAAIKQKKEDEEHEVKMQSRPFAPDPRLRNAVRNSPQHRAMRAAGVEEYYADRYYTGYICSGFRDEKPQNYVDMTIARERISGSISIILRDEDIAVSDLYKHGYCVAANRNTDVKSSEDFLTNTYITHNWENVSYALAGEKIVTAEYFRSDNSSDPHNNEYRELKPDAKMQRTLLQEAYFYLYLAEQLINSAQGNCFERKADINDIHSLNKFYYDYLYEYVKAHLFHIQNNPEYDWIDFAVTVNTDGAAKLIPSSIHHLAEQTVKKSIEAKIDSFKTGLKTIIYQHIHTLKFIPAEKKCKAYSSKVRLHFRPKQSPTVTEEYGTFPEE